MTRQIISVKKTTLIALLSLIILVVLFAPVQLPAGMGATDFRPYWSSTYLLARGEDFGDLAKMDAVERTLTGWDKPYTMSAWFAPTGNVVLLPYTLFSFPRAVYYWLLTNIVVVFSSALLLWRNRTQRPWIALAASFSFSMTLISLMYGQVNTLVLLGIALYLHFGSQKHDLAAGASLALTTVKPHLVILTLPLLLVDLLQRRQWRTLAGFCSALAGGAAVLFLLNPPWLLRFYNVVAFGMGTFRETPTLNGLLVAAGEFSAGKWLWVAGLLAALLLWRLRGKSWDQRSMIDVSILAGLMLAPVGWSYDQVMLLVPLLHVLEWAADGSLARHDAVLVSSTLLITNALTFYQRSFELSEVWFFWVPLAAAALYGFARRRKKESPPFPDIQPA
jgi:hypothetical protein